MMFAPLPVISLIRDINWDSSLMGVRGIRLVKFRPTILGSAHLRTVKMLLTEAGQSNGKFYPRSNCT